MCDGVSVRALQTAPFPVQRDFDGIFAAPEKYDPNVRWHRLRKAAATILTAPK